MAESLDAVVGPAGSIRGQLELTADGKGLKAPDNIIKSVIAARAVYHKYRTDHIKRIQLYSQIEGLIAGNPPYSPAELQKHGLLHIANFNTLDARALYERAALAYWNLLNQAETLVRFEVRVPDPESVRYADVMAKNWNYVIRQWASFDTLMNTLSGQLVKFGISPVLWPDERDWKWRVVELPKFFVTDQAQSDIAQLTAVCVETPFTAQYLFGVYEAYKDMPKDSCPWDMTELSHLLMWLANSHSKTQGDSIDFMDLQRRLQNGDLCYDDMFSDDIRLVSLLYQEYDGQVSHYMFHRTYDAGNLLYFADRQYKSMQEAMVIFTGSPGEFTVHSNRGLGHKIFALSQAMMQLDCSIVDMARCSSTPLIRGLSTGSRDVETIRFYSGVPTNIGTAEFVQNQLGANIGELIGASQYLLQKLQFNTANSGDDPGSPDASHGSVAPSQARMMAYKEFGVLKNNIAHFYKQFDHVVQNMTLKMLHSKKGYPGYEEAQLWKELCIEEGVPDIVFKDLGADNTKLPKHIRVFATRVAGDGSTLARIMGLQELMPIAGDFGPREAKEYRRQWIMATMGPEYVDTFMQTQDDADNTAGGASLAAVENAIMRQGEGAVYSKDNDQRAHLTTHMALATSTIQLIQQQQMDPVAADKVFSQLVPHLQEHFQAVAQSPFAQDYAASMQEGIGQVVKYATLNRRNAEQMMQAQIKKQQEQEEATQQVMTEEELKNLQVVNEEKRKDFKINAQVQRASDANATRAQVMLHKVDQDSAIQKQRTTMEAKNKAFDIALKHDIEKQSLQENREELSEMTGATPSPVDFEGAAKSKKPKKV